MARIGLELSWIPLIAELEFIWIRAREPPVHPVALNFSPSMMMKTSPRDTDDLFSGRGRFTINSKSFRYTT